MLTKKNSKKKFDDEYFQFSDMKNSNLAFFSPKTKTIKFGSYADFLKNIAKPLENLSAIKLKRVSKAFLLALGELTNNGSSHIKNKINKSPLEILFIL